MDIRNHLIALFYKSPSNTNIDYWVAVTGKNNNLVNMKGFALGLSAVSRVPNFLSPKYNPGIMPHDYKRDI